MPESTETLPTAPAVAAKPMSARQSARADLEAFASPSPVDPNSGNDGETKPPEKPSTPFPEAKLPETKAEKKAEVPGEKKTDESGKPEGKEKPDKRSNWEALQQKAIQAERERDEWKSKHEALSKAPPPEDTEKPKLRETLAEREKRLAELEDKMRFVDYEKSTEYQDKYRAPLNSAMTKAWKDVEQLLVTEDDGTERVGTPDDFNKLCRMPLQQAIKAAKERFGDAATEVLAHRRKLIELNDESTSALERFRKEGGEREKKQSEEQAARAQAVAKSYDSHSKTLLEKFPKWYLPEEGDDDGNKLLEQGKEVARIAFGDGSKAESETMAQLQAEIGLRAAGFGKAVHQNKKLFEENKSLRARLEKFEASDPGKGDGDGGADTNGNGAGGKVPTVRETLMQISRGK